MNNTAIAIDYAKSASRFLNVGGRFMLPVTPDVKKQVVIKKLRKAGLTHSATSADMLTFIKA